MHYSIGLARLSISRRDFFFLYSTIPSAHVFRRARDITSTSTDVTLTVPTYTNLISGDQFNFSGASDVDGTFECYGVPKDHKTSRD